MPPLATCMPPSTTLPPGANAGRGSPQSRGPRRQSCEPPRPCTERAWPANPRLVTREFSVDGSARLTHVGADDRTRLGPAEPGGQMRILGGIDLAGIEPPA